jgi:hypothetical protein
MEGKPITKMIAILFLAFVALASAMATVPVSACRCLPERVRCKMSITIDISLPGAHWIGNLSGGITGKIEFWENFDGIEEIPARTNIVVPGKIEIFFERFLITTDLGTIEGFDVGIWSFKTFKFSAGGYVTNASSEYADLIGFRMNEMGVTSPFPPIAPATTINATATMTLTVASAPSAFVMPCKALRSRLTLKLVWADAEDPNPHWHGRVRGCINGRTVDSMNSIFTSFLIGNDEIYSENFTIKTVGGQTIEGWAVGVYNMETLRFFGFGLITAGTGRWACLVDSKVYIEGKTTPMLPPPGLVTAKGEMAIVHE